MATWYLVRVELSGEKHGSAAYETLHANMAAAKFHRRVTTNQVEYKLPPAEYIYVMEGTSAANVSTFARDIAQKIPGQVARVVVAKTTDVDFAHLNLEKA